jgi:hypothetical protein
MIKEVQYVWLVYFGESTAYDPGHGFLIWKTRHDAKLSLERAKKEGYPRAFIRSKILYTHRDE